MRGKCSFSDCAFTDEDDVDATKCSSCSKKVHHTCSNAIYEGELSIRVCSHSCVIALGLPTQLTTLGASSGASTSGKQSTDGARAHGKAARKRSEGKKKVSAQNSNKKKSKQAKADDHKKQGEKGFKRSVNTSKKVNAGKKSSVGKSLSKRTSTTPVKQANTSLEETTHHRELQKDTRDGESCISQSDHSIDGITHVNEDDSADGSSDDAKQNDKQTSKRKKFHFTAEDDLALLKEILNVQSYAVKHGSVTTRYQDVADNFKEHLGEELSLRTIEERFLLLVKEFKTTDSEYRKKSGVAEEYTEHKQLLQDITDAMRDLQDEKRKRRKQPKISRIGLNQQVKGFDTKH